MQTHTRTHANIDSRNISSFRLLRTIGSESFLAFKAARSNLKQPKMFGNMVHELTVSGPSNTLNLELIPPMELHFLLGIVNHLFKSTVMASNTPHSR